MKLIKFLMQCTNEQMTIELKDGQRITGRLTGCDMCMNLHLSSVKIHHHPRPRPIPPSHSKSNNNNTKQASQNSTVGGGDDGVEKVDSISVRGNSIRYIHLPDALPLDTLLHSSRLTSSTSTSTSKSAKSKSNNKNVKDGGKDGGSGNGNGKRERGDGMERESSGKRVRTSTRH